MTVWPIYTGTGGSHDGIDRLPAPPNWRAFDGGPPLPSPDQPDPGTLRRLGQQDRAGSNGRVPDEQEIQMVNAALFLRRPLLVTGRPGTGKSSLAYSIAKELKLGPVLRWPITSRSTLLEGLYRYDAIGQLREENLWQLRARASAEATPTADKPRSFSRCRVVRRGHRAAPAARAARHLAAALQPAAGAAHRRDRQERHRPAERPAQRVRRGRVRNR